MNEYYPGASRNTDISFPIMIVFEKLVYVFEGAAQPRVNHDPASAALQPTFRRAKS